LVLSRPIQLVYLNPAGPENTRHAMTFRERPKQLCRSLPHAVMRGALVIGIRRMFRAISARRLMRLDTVPGLKNPALKKKSQC